MIEKRPDWTISRQRYWEYRFPLHSKKRQIKRGSKAVPHFDEAEKLINKFGIEGWHDFKPEQISGKDGQWKKSIDTLDVWFDSGRRNTQYYKVHKGYFVFSSRPLPRGK